MLMTILLRYNFKYLTYLIHTFYYYLYITILHTPSIYIFINFLQTFS